MHHRTLYLALLVIALAVAAALFFDKPSQPVESSAAPSISGGVKDSSRPFSGGQDKAGAAANTMPLPPPVEDNAGANEGDEEEIQASIERLHDADPETRAEGAFQLGTYPTQQAEAELVRALRADPEASVREAAAQTLIRFNKPSKDTWKALLFALEDGSVDVQSSALSTLETTLMQLDDPRRIDWLRDAIRKLSFSTKITEETRESLQSLMEQLESAASDTP